MDYDLQLLKELVAMDTDVTAKRNYMEMARLLRTRLREIGAKVEILDPGAPDGKPRPNVIGRIDNNGSETIGLNAHFDTVPTVSDGWRTDPFTLTVSGGRAYGRGTSDDKSGIVAAMAAAREARCRANVEFIITCDEEVGSELGLEWVLNKRRQRIKSSCAVVLDTKRRIDVGASGTAHGTITVMGKEVHAAYPHLGKNAISASLPFLTALQGFDRTAGRYVSRFEGAPGRKVYGRFNVTMLDSGMKHNLIPGRLVAGFDMRSIPEVSVRVLMKRFGEHFRRERRRCGVDARLDYTLIQDGWVSDPDSEVVRRMVKATGIRRLNAEFGGDSGTFFSAAGIPVVSYGCSNHTSHGSNEYVSVKTLRAVERDMTRFLEGF